MTIKQFIEKYCKVRGSKIYMNNCYLTAYYKQNRQTTFNDWLLRFFIKHGIFTVESYKDFLGTMHSDVACIGYSEREQKWYGWSHRAIFGFGIGYKADECSCCVDSGWTQEYLREHPEEDKSVPVGFEVKNMDDAKRCAIAFAMAVS